MKRFLAAFLTLAIVFSLCACQGVKENETASTTSTSKKENLPSAEETFIGEDETQTNTEQETENGTTAQNTTRESISQQITQSGTKAPSTTKKQTTTKKPSTTKKSGNYEEKPPINTSGVVTNEEIEKIKAKFLRLINDERKAKGLSPLTLNRELDRAAVVRSREITSVWSHTRPDGTDYYTAVNESKYFYASIGENIGKTSFLGNGTAAAGTVYTGSDAQIDKICMTMFTMFKNSPTHYANIIASHFSNTGIGISCKLDSNGLPMFYISQIFGSK